MLEQGISFLSTQAMQWFRAISEGFMQDAIQTPVYAATVTPTVEFSHTIVVVGILTGNITIGAPIGARRGMKLTFVFTQDGTGTRTVTWNAVFAASANSGTTANHKAATMFTYDGTRWVQDAGAMTFKA